MIQTMKEPWRLIRILFVNPFSDVDGPARTTTRLMLGLDSARFASTLICPGQGRLTQLAHDLGLHAQAIPLQASAFTAHPLILGRQLVDTAKTARGLSRFIRRGGYDLVQVNSHLVGPVCTLAARMARVPIVWRIAEIYQTTQIKRKIIAYLVRHLPDAVVAVSDAVAAQLSPCSKVHRVYNGLDVSAYEMQADRDGVRRELGFDSDDVVIGCMGRLSSQKGQDVFLRSAQIVAERHQRAHFLIAGDDALGEHGHMSR